MGPSSGWFVFNHDPGGIPEKVTDVGLEEGFQLGIENDSGAGNGWLSVSPILDWNGRKCRNYEDVSERDSKNNTGSLEVESHGEWK